MPRIRLDQKASERNRVDTRVFDSSSQDVDCRIAVCRVGGIDGCGSSHAYGDVRFRTLREMLRRGVCRTVRRVVASVLPLSGTDVDVHCHPDRLPSRSVGSLLLETQSSVQDDPCGSDLLLAAYRHGRIGILQVAHPSWKCGIIDTA